MVLEKVRVFRTVNIRAAPGGSELTGRRWEQSRRFLFIACSLVIPVSDISGARVGSPYSVIGPAFRHPWACPGDLPPVIATQIGLLPRWNSNDFTALG
jgi:hypothetical protein